MNSCFISKSKSKQQQLSYHFDFSACHVTHLSTNRVILCCSWVIRHVSSICYIILCSGPCEYNNVQQALSSSLIEGYTLLCLKSKSLKYSGQLPTHQKRFRVLRWRDFITRTERMMTFRELKLSIFHLVVLLYMLARQLYSYTSSLLTM